MFTSIVVPLFLKVILVALIVRLPLYLLPGFGRDEAAYFYWANHPEYFYSSFLQVILYLFQWLPFDLVINLRLAAALTGLAAIYLLDRVFKMRGIKQRGLALLVFALCPWQTYAGSIIHPDNFQFIMVLLMVLGLVKERYYMAAVCAGMAALAKPSGLIAPAALALYLAFLRPQRHWPTLIGTSALTLLVASPLLFFLNLDMMQAISEYGRIDFSQNFLLGMASFLLPTLLLAGPLPLVNAAGGLKEIITKTGASLNTIRALPASTLAPVFTGLCFLLVFSLAAISRGQLKGNWMLPGIFLLWPVTLQIKKKGILYPFLVYALASGVFISLVFSNPGTMQYLEKRLRFLSATYSGQAGEREEKYQAASSWTKRLNEYQSITSFARQVRATWPGKSIPAYIVSDDYGLAAQLAAEWHRANPRIIIYGDGIFRSTVPFKIPPAGQMLILAVNKGLTGVWPSLQHVVKLANIEHPVGHHTVTIGQVQATNKHD